MAYSPSGPGQASAGWYFWTWKTEWEIDTWSYRRGWQDGWIPADVGNASTYAFPVLESGCVDAEFGWEAPEKLGAAVGLRVHGLWWGLVVGVCGVLVA